MLAKAEPALAVATQLLFSANIKPPIVLGLVFVVHSKPALPVEPAVALVAHTQPSATLLLLPGLEPTSYNSLSDADEGLDAFQSVKFALAVVVILEQLPKIKTAEFAVTVVIAGMLEVDCD
jgi:hypothetical protein